MNWTSLFLRGGTLGFSWAADIDSSALLARVQSKVRDEATRIPRFVCRQEINRQVFITPKRSQKVCTELTDQGPSKAAPGKLTLVSSNRARLEVMLERGSRELFSWPGGGSFDTSYPGDLLGGELSSSGDCAGFMIEVLGTSQATFQYVGPCAGVDCVRYSYNVPRNISRFGVQVFTRQGIVGYHGIVDVDSNSANILQLTVIPTGLPKVLPGTCSLRTRMIYTRAAGIAGEFSIPKSSAVEFLYKNGQYSENRTSFEDCREYSSESVLSFGDDFPAGNGESKVPPALPKLGSELQLRLASKIDSDVSIAGDSLEASLVHAIRDNNGGSIPQGTVFRGHLALLERVYGPHPEVLVVMRFDTAVLHGQTVAVKLFPTGPEDFRGRAVFRFRGKRAVLDSNFVSRWRALP